MIRNKGFTLIELLVVISIISLLSSVVFSALGNVRASGRDSKRLADLHQMQLALEMYYAEKGSYPYTSWQNSSDVNWQTGKLATALEPYLPTLPVDPINTGTQASSGSQLVYSYFSTSYGSTGANDNKWYMLVFNLENDSEESKYDRNSVACDGQVFNYDAVVLNGNCVN